MESGLEICPGLASALQWAHPSACVRLPGTWKEVLPFLQTAGKGRQVASLFTKPKRERRLVGAHSLPSPISGNGPLSSQELRPASQSPLTLPNPPPPPPPAQQVQLAPPPK
jgi:hypothetical protein